MKRKRQQAGTIFQARGIWYVRFFEDRVENGAIKHARIAKQIAPVTTRGKRPPLDIEDEAKAIVSAATVASQAPERVLTVRDFIDQVYFHHIEPHAKASTLKGYREIWKNHVKAQCADGWLKNVRTYHVQSWLNAMASGDTLGRNSLKHIKSFMSAVFRVAKQLGYYIGENPVRDTAISPTAAEPGETYAYSLAEILAILRVLPLRAATVYAVASFTGIRKGEIQGLTWENYQDGTLRVTRAICEGHVGAPKTKRSRGAMPVIKQLGQILDRYRMQSGNPTAGPIFRSSNGKPASLGNLLNREVLPFLDRCAICGKLKQKHADAKHNFLRDESIPTWRGWHACRRGLGSNLYALGVPDKVIQAILRHANVSTTNTYYIKTVPQELLDAMTKLENALPSSLTVNEVSTDESEQPVSSTVN